MSVVIFELDRVDFAEHVVDKYQQTDSSDLIRHSEHIHDHDKNPMGFLKKNQSPYYVNDVNCRIGSN